MVVGFYPGAGGHRYCLSLNQQEYQTPNAIYDLAPTDANNRYTTWDSVSNHRGPTTTHCVNAPVMKNAYQHHDEFVIIKADLKKCLHREYQLIGIQRYNTNLVSESTDSFILEHYQAVRDSTWPECSTVAQYEKLDLDIRKEVEYNRNQISNNVNFLAAEATINFHLTYYAKYPIETYGATVVDIDNDDTEFCATMRQELATPCDDAFESAWEQAHG